MEPWQTRASEFHPYLIATIDEAPDDLRPLVEAALPSDAKLASGLIVPANYRSKTPDADPQIILAQALIFTGEGVWHIQAAEKGQPAPPPIYIAPHSIRWIRSSHLLLYGRLEVAGALQGQPVKLDIEFNAVGWRQKDQNWRNLVAQSVGMPPIPPDVPHAPSERERTILQGTPEKFVDGLYRYGLYTGETLLSASFQPAIWQQHLIAFDEQLAPDTLLALTNASVLILTEEKALVRRSDDLGLLITRIPRQAIIETQVEKGSQVDVIVFSLSRAGVSDAYRLAVAHDAAQRWLEMWEMH